MQLTVNRSYLTFIESPNAVSPKWKLFAGNYVTPEFSTFQLQVSKGHGDLLIIVLADQASSL